MFVLWGKADIESRRHHPTPACRAMSMLDPTVTNWFDDPASSVLVPQELGILAPIKRAVRVLTAAGDDRTNSTDPSRVMMRQIAGSFAHYEKTRLVAKLVMG
jgi:hypothetical protein